MSSNNADVTSYTTVDRLTGRVKWFNNKAGYGFITITDSSSSSSLPAPGSDIFVHHSSIQVENQQYRYLVQGEYVEFSLSKTESGKHEYQASNVSGIKGGKLMCETRREFKIARTSYKGEKPESNENNEQIEEAPIIKQPRQKQAPKEARAPRVRGEGPRESNDNKDWTMVQKRPNNFKEKQRSSRPSFENK